MVTWTFWTCKFANLEIRRYGGSLWTWKFENLKLRKFVSLGIRKYGNLREPGNLMIGERAGIPRGFANSKCSKFANLEIWRYAASLWAWKFENFNITEVSKLGNIRKYRNLHEPRNLIIRERVNILRAFANFQLSKFADLEIYRYQSSSKLFQKCRSVKVCRPENAKS